MESQVSLPFLSILKHIFDHLSYEGTINKPDSPQVYIPQQISDDLQSLTLNDYFFADTYDLDYATLYRLADELHF